MPVDFSMDTAEKRPQGYLVSRRTALALLAAACAVVVLTAVITHNLSNCGKSNGDHSALNNVLQEPVLADTKVRDVRLPRSVVPDSYQIRLVPHLWGENSNYTFSGQITIRVNVTEDTDNVTLHGNALAIKQDFTRIFTVSKENGGLNSAVPLESQRWDVPRQFFIMKTSQTLKKGQQYEVQMRFTGHLNDLLQGFYKSSYIQDNKTKWIATTQFQPTDARQAFPCFDEPALKAKFKISLARPKEFSAISNMPKKSGPPESVDGLPGWEWDHFEESVPMSTYLVAFVVSEFSHKVNGSFAVWTRRDAIEQADYALHVGPSILKYFEQYFQIPFPLPKIDMVALPDFAAGAMENWGLITYRETAMLYEEGVSASSSKQRVATVVSHELAHQWFGNLVTPEWWTDLWLNEGFATYVEYLGVDAVEPSWQIMEQFVIDEIQNVFSLDALESSHPISIEVGHPDEINEIFDRISYHKGASIIRMMDHFLTHKVFSKGLNNYLRAKKFSSATQNDLWKALTNQAYADKALQTSMSVAEIMNTWTLQTGFPVIKVVRKYSDGTATFTQSRFLLDSGNGNETRDEKSLWWVPITYTTDMEKDFNTTKPKLWLKAEPSIAVENLPKGDHSWLLLNIQQTGFYRVNYDKKNWALLTAALNTENFSGIHVINRAQLLDDALALARAGQLDYATALGITSYLEKELEYIPWKAALNALSYIDTMLVRTSVYANFKAYMRKLIERLYVETGSEEKIGEPQLIIYKRVKVMSWACSLGHEGCINHSINAFSKWLSTANPDKENPVPVNLKNVIYCTAIKHGGQKEWEFLWQRYLKANVGSERDLLLTSLGCTRETWLLNRYLLWAVSNSSGIRKQDCARVFGAVSSNVIGSPIAFNFLRDEWERIKEYLGSSLFSVSSMIRTSTHRLQTSRELLELKHFAEKHRSELGPATRAVEQSIERAQANVNWMAKNAGHIESWLRTTLS